MAPHIIPYFRRPRRDDPDHAFKAHREGRAPSRPRSPAPQFQTTDYTEDTDFHAPGFGGFAYASPFEVRRHEETAEKSVLALGLRDAQAFPAIWDGSPFDLEVVYTLTPESLTVELKTKNL